MKRVAFISLLMTSWFEFGRTYAIEVSVTGNEATLRIDGTPIATSHPKQVEARTFSFEGGGIRSRSSAEFSEVEVTFSPQRKSFEASMDAGEK